MIFAVHNKFGKNAKCLFSNDLTQNDKSFTKPFSERLVNAFMNGRSLVVHCERSVRKYKENKRENRERSVNDPSNGTTPVHSPRFFRNGGEV